jgi:hypothetical protein
MSAEEQTLVTPTPPTPKEKRTPKKVAEKKQVDDVDGVVAVTPDVAAVVAETVVAAPVEGQVETPKRQLRTPEEQAEWLKKRKESQAARKAELKAKKQAAVAEGATDATTAPIKKGGKKNNNKKGKNSGDVVEKIVELAGTDAVFKKFISAQYQAYVEITKK